MAEFRKLKSQARQWLAQDDWQDSLDSFAAVEPEKLVGPLFSLLLHDGVVKWRAVTVLGQTIARMAAADMNQARVVMRRLIWNMSEESGNLGWGAPESMGEIMAVHKTLAGEFGRVLVSYIIETGRDDNFIDHLPLRIGAYWGVGRMAQEHPWQCLSAVAPCLRGLGHPEGFENETSSATVRGLCAWTLGSIGSQGQDALSKAEDCPGGVCVDLSGLREQLSPLLADDTVFQLYRDRELSDVSVASLAQEALDRLPS